MTTSHRETAAAAIASHTAAFEAGAKIMAELTAKASQESVTDAQLVAENADAVAAVNALQDHLASATAQLEAFAAQYRGSDPVAAASEPAASVVL